MMNILESTYMLTTSIKKNFSEKMQLRKIIEEINKNRLFSTFIPQSIPVQFAGPLIVHHQQKSIMEKSDININDLPTKIIDKISNVFFDFNYINYKCLEPVLSRFPQLDIPLIHYFEFAFPKPQIEKNRDIQLFESSLLDKFLHSFWDHPCIKIIDTNFPLLKNPEDIVGITRKMEKEIDTGIISDSPEFIRIMHQKKETTEKRIFDLLFAIVSLRKSILILNEMLYLAILYDHLPCIDSSNLIAYPKCRKDFIRDRLEAICQPNEKNKNIFGKDILFILNYDLSLMKSKLYFCQEKEITFSQDFGDEVILFADNIDINLNPYANLIKNFNNYSIS